MSNPFLQPDQVARNFRADRSIGILRRNKDKVETATLARALMDRSNMVVMYATAEGKIAGSATAIGGTLQSRESLATFDRFGQIARNSVFFTIAQSIDGRLPGKTAANMPIFSTQIHTGSPRYVRNPNCWAADIDMCSASVWNSHFFAQGGGILISPRHILLAEHFFGATGSHPVPNGTTFRWVTRDNVIVERTLTNKARVGAFDVCIGVLNADIPDDVIAFARCLPEDYTARVQLHAQPIVISDQEKKAIIKEWKNSNVGAMELNWYEGVQDSQRAVFNEEMVLGDSGGPMYLVVGNQAVVLGAITGVTWGSELSRQLTAVNSVMASLGAPYQLTPVAIEAFLPPRIVSGERLQIGLFNQNVPGSHIINTGPTSLTVGGGVLGLDVSGSSIGIQSFGPLAGRFVGNNGGTTVIFNATDGGTIADFQQQETTVVLITDSLMTLNIPFQLPSYAKTSLPSVALGAGTMIYVTNDIGGAVPAFSDGTNWRRVTDRNVIS